LSATDPALLVTPDAGLSSDLLSGAASADPADPEPPKSNQLHLNLDDSPLTSSKPIITRLTGTFPEYSDKLRPRSDNTSPLRWIWCPHQKDENTSKKLCQDPTYSCMVVDGSRLRIARQAM
jgi:hypothetical protein